MHLPMAVKQALQMQSVIVDRLPAHPFSSSNPEILIEELKDWSGTENNGVAVSYFFRQIALFVTAQFSLIHQQGGYFKTPPEKLGYGRIQNYGLPLISFHVESADFIEIPAEQRSEAFRYVLIGQTDALLRQLRRHAKISPITCWENVLGSLAWYYANLQRHYPLMAAEDLEWLMEDQNWEPLRKSQWRNFIGTTPLERAVSVPMRKTCCLYKELAAFDTCTFCPQPH
ncbi:hypothetical protein BBI15_08890 [Planococcus plakortidis]|uniref:Aerobactin siderophore biosynthesis IucA/IucC-like C-terminal domain-containing protein n=1 Tax=Planococcus plakortidis TaxID=1038856 RepID=A0A1C7E8M7_9BACL|nr:IucA/IucC family C-terminal-domain containing protein [Planococcus plakortidis]ANU20324.1 hypothetical protein BBI15_08890 [Planococcus plakortidis]